MRGFDGFFWIFFAMNIVFLLIAYAPLFPAFLKLRSADPHANRVFKVPGGPVAIRIYAYLPVLMLALAMIATIVPFNSSPEEMSKIPMVVGVLVFMVLGEIARIVSARNRRDEYKGMAISGDPVAWDEARGYVLGAAEETPIDRAVTESH